MIHIKKLIALFSLLIPFCCSNCANNYFLEDPNFDYYSNNKGVYTFSQALEDVGVPVSRKSHGEGIKILILDNCYPDNISNLTNTTYSYSPMYDSSCLGAHASNIYSILGGDYGIANEAELIFFSKTKYSMVNGYNKRRDLVQNIINDIQPNIVCHSSNLTEGYDVDDNYGYNVFSYFMDHYLHNSNILWINSLGNNSNDNQYIHNTATPLNVISVGASDIELKASTYINQYAIPVGQPSLSNLAVPTILAPGLSLSFIKNVVEYPANHSVISGTSYAAPFVAGIAALLMSEFPVLKTNIERLVSLLCVSCTRATNQITAYDSHAGFGIVNYQNARLNFLTSFQKSLNVSETINTPILLDYNEEIKAHSYVSNVANHWPLSYGGFYTISASEYSTVSISLLDSNNNIVATSSNKSNHTFIVYNNNTNNTSFTLRFSISKNSSISGEKMGYSYSKSNKNEPTFYFNINGGYYLDEVPIFNFGINGLYSDYNIYVPIYKIHFYNYYGETIFSKTYSTVLDPTIYISEYHDLIDEYGEEYFVSIVLSTGIVGYTDYHYSSKLTFNEPKDYHFSVQIKPYDWGFEERYYFLNEGIKETDLYFNNLSVHTKRLRCGYIEEEYINLSPRRTGAGEAYLELDLSSPIYGFGFGLCWWSPSEYIDLYHDTYIVETQGLNGVWSTKLDILNSAYLSDDREIIKRFYYEDSQGIYKIRFYAQSTAYGTWNKGRLCIDDIVLNFEQNLDHFYHTNHWRIV